MALFQCILEGGRIGHATVNRRLKDENDKEKKKRERSIFFFSF